jgi:3-oxoacyl-[acyl-carrier protein] reductase
MYEQGLLCGKTALITGAGSGIGYGIAEELLAAGASVGLHYRSNQKGIERLSATYGDEKCFAIQADFEDPSSPEEILSAVHARFQNLDILINNAAWIEPRNWASEIDEAVLVKTFRINTIAPLILSKLALEKMRRAKSGRIVTISTIGVKYSGSTETLHYAASKAALETAMLGLAKAVASEGILINVVRAGVTRTAAHERLGRTDMASREAMIPLKRAAEPDEIAKVVTFLVSPLNTYMTGCIVPVAGGE